MKPNDAGPPLGTFLQQWRDEHELSQEGLAEYLGVSRDTVSKWERSESLPPQNRVERYARKFSESADRAEFKAAWLRSEQSKKTSAEPARANATAPGAVGANGVRGDKHDIPERDMPKGSPNSGLRRVHLLGAVLLALVAVLLWVWWLVIAHQGAPVGRVTSIKPLGPCKWSIWLEVTGFRPRASVSVSNYYRESSHCSAPMVSSAWGPVNAGHTDDGGRWTVGYLQGAYGHYDYVVSDGSQSVHILLTYGRNQGVYSH